MTKNLNSNVSDPHPAGGTLADAAPDSHAARHGVTCRRCAEPWPCPGSSSWEGRHFPSLIPNGAVVNAVGDLHRLINWAPRGNCPVVLDSVGVSWILFETEDGDAYAGTMECPDDNLLGRYDLDDLPALRGPLYVLFNGDTAVLPAGMQTHTQTGTQPDVQAGMGGQER